MSKLYIVGIGPGSPDYVTPAARKAINSSEIIIGSKRALDLFPGVREKIEMKADDVQQKLKLALDVVRQGNVVSVLSTGDPGFSGVLNPILRFINDTADATSDIEIKVIPGISSMQLCAARLQISWDNTDFITLHGKGVSQELLDVLDNGKPTIILPNFKVEEIARFLLDNGVNTERRVAVCEKLSYPDEKIVKTTLKGLLDESFSYMCVIVIF